jgi:hypothetical protein
LQIKEDFQYVPLALLLAQIRRRAFCEATGLGEDMLSHVLAGRKDLSVPALTRALERIGYRLRIVPAPAGQPAARRQKRSTVA